MSLRAQLHRAVPAICWAGVTGTGAALCFLPLFSLLGMESSAVSGVAVGLAAMALTLRRLGTPYTGSPAALYFELLPKNLALVLPPLCLLSLNALRVRNCDLSMGVEFFALIPVVSVVVGQTIAWASARLLSRGRWLLCAGALLLDVGVFLERLANEPPIQGFSLLFGWFPGSIYDEALSVPGSLRWYRLTLLGAAAAVVLADELRFRWQERRPHKGALAGLIAVTLVTGWAIRQRQAHGIGLDHADVERSLGGELETAHFVIHYSAGDMNPESLRLLALDHEYRYSELLTFFEEDPVAWHGRKLGSYVYPDRQSQSKLMGSNGTLIARPWTGEMHIRWEGFGDTSLAHELAHLFTAPFGGGPLHLATDGGLAVNIGLVEGIALAADWPPDELMPHEAAAAMKQLDIMPNLRPLFRVDGFWSQPGNKAYTLMGSFVRWLVETQGITKFKAVYAEGDWTGVYGKPARELVSDWEAFIDTVPVDAQRIEPARQRYSRSSIFEKTCARTIADLTRKSGGAEGRGDYAEAIQIRKEILRFEPKKTEHLMALSRLLDKSGDREGAIAVLDQLLERKLKEAQRMKVLEEKADLLWKSEHPEEARAIYAECGAATDGDSARRRLATKSIAVELADPALRDLAARYLLDDDGRAVSLYLALKWAGAAPEDPLPRYLVGLQLFHAQEWEDSIDWLSRAAHQLPTEALEDQRRISQAGALLRLDRTAEAMAVYEELLGSSSSLAVETGREGVQRCRWALASVTE